MFKAFGSAPTSINFAETFSVLQTHIVIAEENLLVVSETTKLYKAQKYCSLTNHLWNGYWLLVNRAAWNDLPADLQAVVARHADTAALDERADIAKMAGGLQSVAREQGNDLQRARPHVLPGRFAKGWI